MGKYFELVQPAVCLLRLNSVSCTCRSGPYVPGFYCWLSGGYECALLADLSKVSCGVGLLIWKLCSSLFFGHFKYSHVLNVPWLCIRDMGCCKYFFVFAIIMKFCITSTLCCNPVNECGYNGRNNLNILLWIVE
jgi:hypothetical protein